MTGLGLRPVAMTISPRDAIEVTSPLPYSGRPAARAKKNRRQPWGWRRCRPRARRGLGLAEQGQDGARALVGDRQRLDAQLLLGLQRLEIGALGREVRV